MGIKGNSQYNEYTMVSKFGAMVYLLPWAKVEMFMECMDIENKVDKMKAKTTDKKSSSQLHR